MMAGYNDLPHPKTDDITLTGVLFALSDPDRLAIARQLREGPTTAVNCMIADPPMPKSTKSHHMKVMREAGVIQSTPEGRQRILELRRGDLDTRFPGLIDAILDAGGESAE